MTARTPDALSTCLADWSVIGNAMPPRDPNDDHDDENEDEDEDEDDDDESDEDEPAVIKEPDE